MDKRGLRVHITGVVQGVGFRPFVYGLATRLELAGWVKNTSAGVDIEVDGNPHQLQDFITALQREIPPLAKIDSLSVEERPVNGYQKFEIVLSEAIPEAFQPISPDVSVCPDCLQELVDPDDRRYRYPFTNCTNCGPRFTIIQDIPYDRPNTTMSGFPLCPECATEYHNPLDRRFHAQPVACPDCGPQVWLEDSTGSHSQDAGSVEPKDPLIADRSAAPFRGDEAILEAQSLLAQGRIVAVKGLGGFHLACDALNSQAVAELRRRKLRVDKPFALMMPDLETVGKHCILTEAEWQLLESRERPIVILHRRPGSPISDKVSPGQDTLGIMLPYTPLHYLLFADHPAQGRIGIVGVPEALVMTSGNLCEEPIATENEEARRKLAPLADAFLMHNRPIRTRCDDSVVRMVGDSGAQEIMPLRRSRGYAPMPVRLAWDSPALLAAGAELKNTFCITRDRYAFLSHHIGDMENYETLVSLEDGIQHFERLFRIQLEGLAYDLHPNYLATLYALERARIENLPAIGVQHHHAHIAACMAENGLETDTTIIGVAFDGTGYGSDGAIWGGEFLLASYQGFERVAHLAYTPLPGGDVAIRKPARTALAYLWQFDIPWEVELHPVEALCAEERTALRSQLEHNINCPPTSSMGRLFDAAAALTGIRQSVNYEAQAAIEFEARVNQHENGAYPFEIVPQTGRLPESISPAPLLAALLMDLRNGEAVPTIAAKFHNGVALMVLDVCRQLRMKYGLDRVALSGGVWQNATLMINTLRLLQKDGFHVYTHRLVPPNDGGISLGQAAVAAHLLKTK